VRAPRGHAVGFLIVLAFVALMTVAAPATASEASAQREGQRLLRSVEDGNRSCSDLSNSDFEAIGEYVMGRMVGTAAAHEQMDELMRTMMGASSEEQMHVFMGRRFTDCGGSTIPGGFGGMMGMMGMIGGGFQQGADGRGFGSMMGSSRVDDSSDGWSGAAIVMTVFMGLLVAGAAVALLLWRPWRGGPPARSAFDLLDHRYARGDIDPEEYERRRKALGGA
jgi:putative membrane protein